MLIEEASHAHIPIYPIDTAPHGEDWVGVIERPSVATGEDATGVPVAGGVIVGSIPSPR